MARHEPSHQLFPGARLIHRRRHLIGVNAIFPDDVGDDFGTIPTLENAEPQVPIFDTDGTESSVVATRFIPCLPSEHRGLNNGVLCEKIAEHAGVASNDLVPLVELGDRARDETDVIVTVENGDGFGQETGTQPIIGVETTDVSASPGTNAVVPGGGDPLVGLTMIFVFGRSRCSSRRRVYSSVDPSSTTIISKSGRLWARTDSTASCR